ncbi:MAG: hypothetical protein Q8941_21730 [Bacteroidota bacterium]|nr:hypothetical protein [Bacteroidota bacterium]
MRTLLFFLFLLSASLAASGQEMTKEIKEKHTKKDKNGFLYFALGSHRGFFTRCDIHVERSGSSPFNFTLEKVRARDEGGLKWETAPQFTYNIGYYFTKKKFGLEYQYDHIKYFVRQNQVVRLKGTIGNKTFNQDTLITPDFFQMEHSDGANYCMFNFVKWLPVAASKDKKFDFSVVLKAGLGFVNPKTNTTIMGVHRDDMYHLSGYITGIESGLKFLFWKHFIVMGTFKGAYADYFDFLIANGNGHHQFLSAQLIYMVGAQFPL